MGVSRLLYCMTNAVKKSSDVIARMRLWQRPAGTRQHSCCLNPPLLCCRATPQRAFNTSSISKRSTVSRLLSIFVGLTVSGLPRGPDPSPHSMPRGSPDGSCRTCCTDAPSTSRRLWPAEALLPLGQGRLEAKLPLLACIGLY